MRRSPFAAITTLALVLAASRTARAGDTLAVGELRLDRPTLVTLGVQLLVSGDDDHDATVAVRYRESGGGAFRDAMPLYRVHPEDVTGLAVPDQFAGSIFDLRPGTTYDLELHVVDPDGVDQTLTTTATTRLVPKDPSSPNAKTVTDAAGLTQALASAQPGDVITLAKGTYAGNFAIDASGTADQPIVVRGEDRDGVVLDGGGCQGCNVLEVYGSFVHVERLTIAHASRAIRFQGQGAEGDVVRRVHIVDTTLGIGSKPDQKDFYLCDNELEGRLAWPSVYWDDGGAHANDDGIHVEGDGHVVCHNRITGYGDAMKTEQDGARAVDFYGNDVDGAYDNGLELDGTAGNARCFDNRFTNTYATLSFQPIFGGPAYAIRNVVVNVANEQMKLHALGTQPPEEPSGIFVLHNTFVSPAHAISLQTTATTHHFVLANNLFVGPDAPDQDKTVDWTGGIDDGLLDDDGYYPDGVFAFNLVSAGGYQKLPNFAAVQAAGLETHGVLVEKTVFASGLAAPPSYTTKMPPPDASLSPGSVAVDHGVRLANVNDGYVGAAPDLGAIEVGCAPPAYGVRAEGVDESNEPEGCGSASTGAGGSGAGGGSASTGAGGGATAGAGGGASTAAGAGDTAAPGDDGGCGCREAPSGGGSLAWLGALVVAVALGRARRRRS